MRRETASCDVVVIGAGIVGLAVGRAFAALGRDVLVLERNARISGEISARNSGVIHAGIYYAAGSLKATLCVRGRGLLYAYCNERGITHRRCGKLVLAQAGQVDALRRLLERGRKNGVTGLELLDAREVMRLEPPLRCEAAIFSPDSGIVDTHELAVSLSAELESRGGAVVLRTAATAVHPVADGFLVTAGDGGSESALRCRTVVNAAGLSSADLLRHVTAYPPDRIPHIRYAKGSYCSFRGRAPFRHLVYPMPSEAGLGVHLVLGVDGRARFGPDVEWVGSPEYGVEPDRIAAFSAAIREYWPALPEDSLAPDFAGVRPKLAGPGEPAADFRIDGPEVHGIPGFVALHGIESPGITAALAIAEHVAGAASVES